MEVRITFRSEVYISGENMAEIRDKWESMNLYEKDNGVGFVEINTVEDAETYNDMMQEFYHAYDK